MRSAPGWHTLYDDQILDCYWQSIDEAVRLADRVAVFSARPGSIKQVIVVDEPHPRRPEFVTSAKFTSLRNHLYGLLHDEIRKAVHQSTAAYTAQAGVGPT